MSVTSFAQMLRRRLQSSQKDRSGREGSRQKGKDEGDEVLFGSEGDLV